MTVKAPTGRTARTRFVRLRLWAAVYLGLLVVSHVTRATSEPGAPAPLPRPSVSVAGVRGTARTTDLVTLAYAYREGLVPDATPVVLLHGSPGTARDFTRLIPLLSPSRRLIIPDLPGFGESSRSVPDYSFRAHARYVLDLLDQLGVPQAHIVGFSMGGGVALELADRAPQRVASLAMLSAIGVQEFELLGNYHLNHAIHGVQLAGLWLLRECFPHMGLLDHSMLSVPYARNFSDSDQRPLRGMLQRLDPPVLIVHGERDVLVPLEAAREHARLVPQSELRVVDGGNHFMVFADPSVVSLWLNDFLDRVDAGAASRRSDARVDRLSASVRPFDHRIIAPAQAVTALVLGGLLVTGSGFWPHLVSAAAGVLVAQGRVSLSLALLACLSGALVHGWRCRRLATETRTTRAASVLLSPLMVLCGSTIYGSLFRMSVFGRLGPWQDTLIVAVGVVAITQVLEVTLSYRRRRLAVARWRRITRWEFWPPWAFYPPLVAYIAWLMLRFRSATVFTAANPAIPEGGFVGESKLQILKGLSASASRVARSGFIPTEVSGQARLRIVETFMAEHGVAFPVVLKPDQGQRGSGVVIAQSAGELGAYLGTPSGDLIVQEYLPGVEFGVFYCRRPSERRGRIISITEKRLITLTGDGRHSLSDLILRDERAVCMAPTHMSRHKERLDVVPAALESVALVELGTHSRGALFLNGESLRTPDLERAFDEVALGFEGFFFGRFDVRATSAEALSRGQGFTIIELNGVTSESTHIYHPGTPLFTAYRVLAAQWRWAFEIGAENVAAGVEPASLLTLLRSMGQYRRTARSHLRAGSVGGTGGQSP